MNDPAELHPELNILIRKLQSIAALSDDEKHCLATLQFRTRSTPADQDIVLEGDRPAECCLVVEGFMCRYKVTEKGKRQIFSFHTPGDIPDLQSLHLKVMDHSLRTITPCKVAFIRHESITQLVRECPRVGDLLWRDTLIDAAIFREWMVGIGRRAAYAKVAHLFCEVFLRMRAVGLTNGYECLLPITQNEIGDSLGLSTVHVNRSLQELRADGLIKLHRNVLTILDWERFKKAGEFDPAYLHLKKDDEAA